MLEDHLHNIRHSFAHVLASAVLKFFPEAKLGVGPVIENGLYYDFLLPRSGAANHSQETSQPPVKSSTGGFHPLNADDLKNIEREMKKIIGRSLPFERQEVSAAEARTKFAKQPFKLELISDLEKHGTTVFDAIQNQNSSPIPPLNVRGGEGALSKTVISIYKTGEFIDLCRGGHAANTKELNADAFKIHKVAGAYWRGDEKREQLQRIYVLAFETKKELDDYLNFLAEAEKRDHKKLGPQLDLFVFSELVGAGLPLWTPKGTLVRNILDNFVWKLREEKGYVQVDIPHITKKDLYEKSGHWDKFKDELFRIKTREGHEFAMKPMNCPHHTQIYARRPWSYRDLPQRYATTTKVYRDEQSGELAGLSRVRAITQDDAHVFCRHSQVKEEIFKIWDIVSSFYKTFGFELTVRLSLHDPAHPEKYLGSAEVWQNAESALRKIVKERKISAVEAPGEAAMYGPKIDFMGKDALGRSHQVATIQLDMNQPERFNLSCKNEKGEDERIVMIHAAIMGSIERFLSVIIEHYAGAFPLWLAPVQVAVLPIGKTHVAYAKQVAKELKLHGIRTELRDDNESVGKKIRESEMQKIPYLLILGDKEKSKKTVAVRVRSKGDTGAVKLSKFLKKVELVIEKKK